MHIILLLHVKIRQLLRKTVIHDTIIKIRRKGVTAHEGKELTPNTERKHLYGGTEWLWDVD